NVDNEVVQGLETTTKPPIVRAVSDLIDILRGKPKSAEKTEQETGLHIEEHVFTRPTAEPPVAAVKDLVNTFQHTRELEDILRGSALKGNNESLSINNADPSCSFGALMFVGRRLLTYEQRFEIVLDVFSLRDCLRLCWDSKCSRAAFTRFPKPTCLMHFEDNVVPLRSACPGVLVRDLASDWKFASIPEVVEIQCIQCVDSQFKDLQAAEESSVAQSNPLKRIIINPQGESEKCQGRVEFQISPVKSLPKLNVSNDVPANSPADCAKKCLEREGCKTAGFVPTSNGAGVCLLTTDEGVCGDSVNHVPQHASNTPFVISCIKCSKCKYSLSTSSSLPKEAPKFEEFANVFSVGQCAEECAKKHCTLAEFNPNTFICSMTTQPRDGPCLAETPVQTDGILPVLLDCVQCFDG
ncbi:hypothetical protein FO519_009208, partial [Halicephalobus sp. NKZ332]